MKRPTADPYVISRAKKSGRWSWWCNRIYCDAYQTDLHAALRRHGSRWLPYCPEERRERAS